MTTVEILAPLRLETRFVPPALRDDGVADWKLRLRVYPDEFSTPRTLQPATPAELDRLDEAVALRRGPAPLSESDAFATFAGAVGAGRALGLWRARVATDADGHFTVDRSGASELERYRVHGPAGLPEKLEVWLILGNGSRRLAATLSLDLEAIADDLDLMLFTRSPPHAGALPATWWLSYPRAVAVGLGIDLDIGAVPTTIDALVVVGIGETDAADLVDAHNATGRMAVLAPGTPTNTVAGEPTTDFGEQAETVYPLLHVKADAQASSTSVLEALCGRVAPAALPMLGGERDNFGPGSLAVQGLWPVLWGRYLCDVTGAGANDIDLARWARNHLAVEGPRPAFRIGEQPYGLLPVSAFGAWADDPGDALGPVEARIRRWALPWRAGMAVSNRASRARVNGRDTAGLLDVLGLHAPTRYWGVRATASRYSLQALRLFSGLPPLDERWDADTALALREVPVPLAPLGRAPGLGGLTGPPHDAIEDLELLRRLPVMHPESYFGLEEHLGLVGHLMLHALIAARAIVGEALRRFESGSPIELGARLPWDDEQPYRDFLIAGDDAAVEVLRQSADPNGQVLAARFVEVQEALQVIADLWEVMPRSLFGATLAALDTAAFRVDPWLTGLADRRLQRLIAERAPFRLGAYGWVDAPAAYNGAPDGPLAPGPNSAGLLHAPSSEQALTAALLRDAALRNPGSDQWRLTIDSAKVRASAALAERVRLGLHPYEALGFEVERIAGDWDLVRVLRQRFALAADQQERRVCDGEQVLRAARNNALGPPDFPADLAARLAPLDDVLDTYADLLLADGVYALVSGHAETANAAMEAASGLGAPPDLRAIRSPRQARTVRVSAWVLLPALAAPLGDERDPVRVADPTWDPALVPVLGRADDEDSLPSLTGGDYEGLAATAEADLHRAIAADLVARLARLTVLAEATHVELVALDADNVDAGAFLHATAVRWKVDVEGLVPAEPGDPAATLSERRDFLAAALVDRTIAAAAMPASAARRALRTLVGRPDLPVLPIVSRTLLPVFRTRDRLDDEWLEIVAAVRPRLTALEARQLDPARSVWPAAVAAPDASSDPWHPRGPVVVAYGPGVTDGTEVALAVLDGWTESVPSRRHTTTAAFGFNAPKSRAPQAVLVAVPPDLSRRLDNAGLLDVVLETRDLVHARVPPQIPPDTLPYPMSTALVSARAPFNFLDGWPT